MKSCSREPYFKIVCVMFRLYHILMTSECKKEQLRRRRWKKKTQKQQVSAMFVCFYILNGVLCSSCPQHHKLNPM